LEDLEKETLIASADDETGLWMVLGLVDSVLPSLSASEKRRRTLQTLRSLLDKKLLRAGEYLPGRGYVWWDLEPDKVIEKIDSDWRALGRVPNIGDIAWFKATSSGKQLAGLVRRRSDKPSP